MCVYMPVDRGCLHKLISQIDTCFYMPVDRGCLHKLISQIDTCFYMPVDRGCLHKLISQIDTDWDILWPKIDKRMMKLSLLTQMKFYCIFALSFCTSLYWSIPVLHVFYLLELFIACQPESTVYVPYLKWIEQNMVK